MINQKQTESVYKKSWYSKYIQFQGGSKEVWDQMPSMQEEILYSS